MRILLAEPFVGGIYGGLRQNGWLATRGLGQADYFIVFSRFGDDQARRASRGGLLCVAASTIGESLASICRRLRKAGQSGQVICLVFILYFFLFELYLKNVAPLVEGGFHMAFNVPHRHHLLTLELS